MPQCRVSGGPSPRYTLHVILVFFVNELFFQQMSRMVLSIQYQVRNYGVGAPWFRCSYLDGDRLLLTIRVLFLSGCVRLQTNMPSPVAMNAYARASSQTEFASRETGPPPGPCRRPARSCPDSPRLCGCPAVRLFGCPAVRLFCCTDPRVRSSKNFFSCFDLDCDQND